MKYANHELGVKRFFKLKSFDVSSGYLEKKYVAPYKTAGGQFIQEGQSAVCTSLVHLDIAPTPKSASSFPT